MHYTVFGSGAIGGTVGAHMVRGGESVLFVDRDAEHVRAMQERGLTIRTHGSDPIVSDARLPRPSPEEPTCSSAAFEADEPGAERHRAATEAEQRNRVRDSLGLAVRDGYNDRGYDDRGLYRVDGGAALFENTVACRDGFIKSCLVCQLKLRSHVRFKNGACATVYCRTRQNTLSNDACFASRS